MEVHKKNYDATLEVLKKAAEGEEVLRKKKTNDTRPPKHTEINGLAEQFTKLFGSTEKLEDSYKDEVTKNIYEIAKEAAAKTLSCIHEAYKKNCTERSKNLVKFYQDMLDEKKGDKEEMKKIEEEHLKVAEGFDQFVKGLILPKKKEEEKGGFAKTLKTNTVSSKTKAKKEVKKSNEKDSQADLWKNSGKTPGLEIWRIEKLKLKQWPPNKYGTFYDGDAFIVLNTYLTKEKKLCWNVHFWLGEKCSIDERTVAAYKTVELDEFLGGGPVQYREVQGHESNEFTSLFKSFNILSGGIESGFNPKEADKYKPKLLHLKGKKNVRVSEVECKASSLNSGDAFILDCGLRVYVWMGKDAGKMEKFQARQVSQNFKTDTTRRGLKVIEIDENGDDDFWEILGGRPDKIKSAEEGGDDVETQKKNPHVLYKLSDASGKIEFEKIKEGPFSRKDLDEKDAFIVDLDKKVYAWVGSEASKSESKLAIVYATDYLKIHNRPPYIPVLLIKPGQKNDEFYSNFK